MTTIKTYIEQHLAQFCENTTRRNNTLPRANTVKAHRLHLERFARQYGAQPTVTVNDAKTFLLPLTRQNGPNGSVSNCNQALTAVVQFYKFLADSNVVSRDDVASLEAFQKQKYRPWKRGTPNFKYLRQEQLVQLFERINAAQSLQSARDTALFALIFFGPARLGELIRLNWCDVSPPLETSQASSRHAQTTPATGGETPPHFHIIVPPGTAKDGERHDLFLFDSYTTLGSVDCFAEMTTYHTWRRAANPAPHDPYFVSIRGKWRGRRLTDTNLHQILSRIAAESGVSATSHYLRHTMGELAAGKLDTRDLRQLYGHSSDSTTEIYTDHQNIPRLRSASLAFAKAITKDTQ